MTVNREIYNKEKDNDNVKGVIWTIIITVALLLGLGVWKLIELIVKLFV